MFLNFYSLVKHELSCTVFDIGVLVVTHSVADIRSIDWVQFPPEFVGVLTPKNNRCDWVENRKSLTNFIDLWLS